jgi:hypothetical protein
LKVNLEMTWKLITNPKVIVEKICNECGKVIETFDSTHPVTVHMVLELGLNEKSDLSVLDMGLQPYHWCAISSTSHCLIPIRTTQREHIEELEKKLTAVNKPQEQSLFPSMANYAPYKPPHTKIKENRGRPPKINGVIYKKKEKDDE